MGLWCGTLPRKHPPTIGTLIGCACHEDAAWYSWDQSNNDRAKFRVLSSCAYGVQRALSKEGKNKNGTVRMTLAEFSLTIRAFNSR